jgi:hypothetical protein
MILDGTIVNGDVNASAAIAGTKISPDFGSQNVTTTGTATAAALIPSGSSVPTNGVYLPSANNVAISTNGTGRLFVDANGNVGLGVTPVSNTILSGFRGSGVPGLIELAGNGNTVGATGFAIGQDSSGVGVLFQRANAAMYFATNGTERLRITSGGNVGIGVTSPDAGKLHILNGADASFTPNTTFDALVVENGTSGQGPAIQLVGATNGIGSIGFSDTTRNVGQITYDHSINALYTYVNGGEVGRWDSSGRFLVGTSTASANYFYSTAARTPNVQIACTNETGLAVTASDGAGSINLASAVNDTSADRSFGAVRFLGYDGTNYRTAASILAASDAATGSADMPGRLVFSTTSDSASSPTERARITSGGYLKVSNSGSYFSSTGSYHEFTNTANVPALITRATNASQTDTVISISPVRAANSAYKMLVCYSGDETDVEFNLRGDGFGLCDNSWVGGGADYAEYFEWSDGNADKKDRRGTSVVLDGNKIRPAVDGEDPIGVISGNPSVVGDAAWNKWNGKYLRDDYGSYVLDETGERQLNPAYDPDVEYISREDRPEWDCVGLMGKLRIRKGQPTGSRWIKMRDISDSVEEWLVR